MIEVVQFTITKACLKNLESDTDAANGLGLAFIEATPASKNVKDTFQRKTLKPHGFKVNVL